MASSHTQMANGGLLQCSDDDDLVPIKNKLLFRTWIRQRLGSFVKLSKCKPLSSDLNPRNKENCTTHNLRRSLKSSITVLHRILKCLCHFHKSDLVHNHLHGVHSRFVALLKRIDRVLRCF